MVNHEMIDRPDPTMAFAMRVQDRVILLPVSLQAIDFSISQPPLLHYIITRDERLLHAVRSHGRFFKRHCGEHHGGGKVNRLAFAL